MDARTIIGLTVAFMLTAFGIGLMLYGLVARPMLMRWRVRHFTEPDVTEADETRARETVTEIARAAGVTVPKVKVVPWLGKPLPGWSGHFGGGGIAVTKFTPGRPTEIVLATGATRVITPAALRHLVAHEMGHVALHATRRGRVRHALWVLAYLVFAALVALAVYSTGSSLLFPFILATIGFWAVRMAYMRRAEREADRFTILLTRDFAGAVELNDAYNTHSPKRDHWFDALDRLFATHPTREKRLAAMAAALEESEH